VEAAQAIEVHNQLLANPPAGARHDADICPICVDKASQTAAPPSRIPPGSAGPDVTENEKSHTSTEGGTPRTMSDNANTISQETHEALVASKVAEATKATDAALATMTAERDSLKTELASVTEERDTLKTDNARLNGDLDKAQIDLKAATDKAGELETELKTERDDRAKADVASKRVEQVKNLGLFSDDYITDEKASAWADLDEAAWTERVDEWSKLKPAGAKGDGTADTASAMTGSSGNLTGGGDAGDQAAETKPTSARRGVLGLA
jgi:regulator of replication initiation timing